MWIISISPHNNSVRPRSIIIVITILQMRKLRLLRKSSKYSQVTCTRAVISVHQCESGAFSLAHQPLLAEIQDGREVSVSMLLTCCSFHVPWSGA